MIRCEDWTREVSDDTFTVVRLECQHAKLVRDYLRSDPTGWLTWCFDCDLNRRVIREIYSPRTRVRA